VGDIVPRPADRLLGRVRKLINLQKRKVCARPPPPRGRRLSAWSICPCPRRRPFPGARPSLSRQPAEPTSLLQTPARTRTRRAAISPHATRTIFCDIAHSRKRRSMSNRSKARRSCSLECAQQRPSPRAVDRRGDGDGDHSRWLGRVNATTSITLGRRSKARCYSHSPSPRRRKCAAAVGKAPASRSATYTSSTTSCSTT